MHVPFGGALHGRVLVGRLCREKVSAPQQTLAKFQNAVANWLCDDYSRTADGEGKDPSQPVKQASDIADQGVLRSGQ